MLSIDQIRKAHGPRFLEIAVPEWADGADDKVRVRRLTAQEWIALSEQRAADGDSVGFMASLIERCAVKEDGAALFSEADRDILTDSPLIILRLGKQILQFNGLLRDGAEQDGDAKKNDSPTGP